MSKVILYIACSTDGYIADVEGKVDWLPQSSDEDFGYERLLNSIDSTLMGRHTYEQILSFGPFPYSQLKNYVFTSRQFEAQESVEFVNGNITDFIRDLKSKEQKDIWLIGGFQLNKLCFENELVDEVILTQIPVILGDGIPLFSSFA